RVYAFFDDAGTQASERARCPPWAARRPDELRCFDHTAESWPDRSRTAPGSEPEQRSTRNANLLLNSWQFPRSWRESVYVSTPPIVAGLARRRRWRGESP